MRVSRQLAVLAAALFAVAPVFGATAAASPDPELCHSISARATIPVDFGVDACFDGSKLVLRDQLTLMLDVASTGDVGKPTRHSSDFGLAADAERLHSNNPDIFLPGDELVYPVGSGAGTVKIADSSDSGFYAIATTIADFFPGKPTAWVQAFTGLVAELDADYAQYQACIAGKNWLQQVGCDALRTRNVMFAVARAGLGGFGSNVVAAVLAPAAWASWVKANVEDIDKSLSAGGLVRIAAASAPATTSTTASTNAASATTTSTTEGAAAFTPVQSWSWDTKNEDGYTASHEFQIGSPASLADTPLLPGFADQSDIANTCSDFSSQTDSLLPVELTLTNTTGGFSRDVSDFFSLSAEDGISDVEVISGYAHGPACADMQQVEATNDQTDWNMDCDGLKPGASCTNYSYIILKNYYSPNTPHGAPAMLDDVVINDSTSTTNSIETYTSETGLGIVTGVGGFEGNAVQFPLGGH